MIKTCTVAFAAMIYAAPAGAQNSPGAGGDPAQRYDACVNEVERDPPAARETALVWRAKGGGAPAQHCLALALAAAEDYTAAAQALDQLAEQLPPGSTPSPADILGQAANAWLLAGELTTARQRIDDAVTRQPKDLLLWKDKIRFAAAAKDYQQALRDVDRSLALAPRDAGLHVLRASALRHLGRMDDARDAIAEAFAIDGGGDSALLERGLIKERRGDTAGAKADWRELVGKYPDGNAAKAAAEHIDRLENPRPLPPKRKPPGAAPPKREEPAFPPAGGNN